MTPTSPPLTVPGYQIFTSPLHKRHAGKKNSGYLPGSCIFVPNNLFAETTPSCVAIEDHCKLLNVTCCMLSCHHSKVLVVSIYRSPSTSTAECLVELRDLLMQLLHLSAFVTIVGDFNMDILSSNDHSDYKNILSDFQFTQHISGPTRVTNSSSTLIDHALSTSNLAVLQCFQATGLSDHQCQIIEVDIPICRSVSHTSMVRSFRQCQWDEVREYLQVVPWQVMDIYDDVNDMWHFFSSILQECMDTFAPLHPVVCKQSRRPTPWMTPVLRDAIRAKAQAKRKADISMSDSDIAVYKQLKNRLKHLVRETKLVYVKELISQSKKDPHSAGKLWRGVNDVIGRYKVRNSVLDEAISVDFVNDFFRSVAVTEDHCPASTYAVADSPSGNPEFQFSTVTSSTVFTLLSALDVRKSVGPDGISARFLKEVAGVVAEPLSRLFNQSLQSGVFPDEWKRCNVTPVHKGGAADNPSNFQPISVVPVVAKVLEKIVAAQLNAHLEEHKLLNSHQCAYRQKKSTEQLLMVAVDSVAQAIDHHMSVCVAFLDLRKAFDSLDHHILLNRLKFLGVCKSELLWFVSYLSDRYQRVKYKTCYSQWGLVKGGIPQGSALGPLLFLIYVNEMSAQVTNGKLLQFADDTALICSGTTQAVVQQNMSNDLSQLAIWIRNSKMQLNISKCSVMWFRSRSKLPSPPPCVCIDGAPLKMVDNQKYLGVVFDDTLQWSKHVSEICKKMSFYLFWINSYRRSLPNEVIKMLIDSLVLSRLIYALPVWGTMLTSAHQQRLQRLHNWGVRIAASLQKYDHVSYHRHKFHWLSVPSLVKYRSLCAMRQIYYSQHDTSLDPPIMFGSSHHYHTRLSSRHICPQRCRLSATQKTFRNISAHWWNDLPDEIATAASASDLYDYILCMDE